MIVPFFLLPVFISNVLDDHNRDIISELLSLLIDQTLEKGRGF